MNYNLEFVYDATVKAITAEEDCDVVYRLTGGGGGGGGYDSPYQGSPGLSGGIVTGLISLKAGETIYCAVGSHGLAGIPGRNAAGGAGGYAIEGYAGGRGGKSGAYGWSGSGGGGGGATVLWKINGGAKEILAVAAGGGGGGGGGHYSPGYIKQYAPWGYTTGNRGGEGEDHSGDGGGPGGGGGGGLYTEVSTYIPGGYLLGGSSSSSRRAATLKYCQVWHPGSNPTNVYVYFPETTQYQLIGAADDIGSVYIDDVYVLNITGWTSDKSTVLTVNSGWRKITFDARNTGGGAGFALRIYKTSNNSEIWNTKMQYHIPGVIKYNGGGQGGVEPSGDSGAMSGSTGYSFTVNPYITELLPSSAYALNGTGGAPFTNGYPGYAGLDFIKRNISVKENNWNPVDRVYVRQNSEWVEPSGVYVYQNNAWKKVYGSLVSGYTSLNQTFDNISGPKSSTPEVITSDGFVSGGFDF